MDCGFYDGPYEPITETHIVQPGDTIDAIAYKYYDKNETRRYFLEFREGIYEQNYWAKDGIYPGDEIIVTYWVRKGSKNEDK